MNHRFGLALALFVFCAVFFVSTPALATDCVEGNLNCTCQTPGTASTCFCDSGWVGDGTNCSDLNECTNPADNNCSANATCSNVGSGGGFTCACNSGFDGDGVTCTDLNECLNPADNNCSVNATCSNVGSGNGFTCACNSGFEGDGVTCTDLNECLNPADNNCSANAACSNVGNGGGFTCACDPGFEGDGVTCTDLNECLNPADNNCDDDALCTNVPNGGGFTCLCNPGFDDVSGGNGTACLDRDECTLNEDNCDVNAACTNTPGSYTCACDPGWRGSGFSGDCADIDECTDPIDTFDCNPDPIAGITCSNTPGAWDCICGPGFVGDGASDCGVGANPPCCSTCLTEPGDLVAWWPANGDAQDVADNPVAGMPQNGAGFGVGRTGQAFVLDGLDDYVEVAAASKLALGGDDFTAVAWVRLTGEGFSHVAERRVGDADDFALSVFGGTTSPVAAPFVRACYADGADDTCWDATVDVADGDWHLLAAVREIAGIVLYVDGVDAGATSSVVTPPATTGFLSIGASLAGSVDELMLYDRALAAAEIADMYEAKDGICQDCAPVPLDATGWWPGNGDGLDLIGANNGTLVNGVGFMPGKVGQSFGFDGVDDHVDVPDAPNLRLEEGEFTVAAWVNLASTGTGQDLVDKLHGPAGWHSKGFIVSTTSAGIVRACYERPTLAPAGIRCWDGTTSVTDGSWHHIAVVKFGDGNSELDIYVDGVDDGALLDGTAVMPTAPAAVQEDPVPMRVGARNDDTGHVDGQIDELILFQVDLSQAEIQALVDAGAGFCENSCEPGEPNCSCVSAPCECAPGFVGDGASCCLPEYDGIVAWWPGQDNANDSAGINDGSFPAAAYTGGKVGRAFDFRGIDESIDVADAPELQLEAGDFSMTAWILIPKETDPFDPDATLSGAHTILDKISDENPAAAFAGYRVTVLAGDEPDNPFGDAGVVRACYALADLGGAGVDGRRCYQGTTNVADGNYHHIAVVKAGVGASDDIKIYVDANEEAMFVGFTGQAAQGTSSMRIGARHGGSVFFDGIIDELMLFDRTLASGEIQSLIDADAVGFCPNECADGTNTCDPSAVCTDALDGFSCECPAGYFGDGFTCRLLCQEGEDNCACSTPGDPDTCECSEGFIGEGSICVDRDECAEGIDNCSPLAVCNNTGGSFECECVVGTGDGLSCEACVGYTNAGDGPVAHWSGDQMQGDTIVDDATASSGNPGIPGAFAAGTYQCTAFNFGFELAGLPNSVQVPDDTTLRLEAGDYSISTWIRFDGSGQVDIIDKLSNPDGSCSLTTTSTCREDSDCPGGEICEPPSNAWVENGYNVTILSGAEPDETTGVGLIRACYSTTAEGGRRCYQGTIPESNVADARNHHIAVVKGDGGSDDLLIYVDGVEQVTTFVQFAVFDPSANDEYTDLWIGARQSDVVTGENHFFTGVIDEVALFDRALSATEVLDIYEAATGICKNECDPLIDGDSCECEGFQCTCRTGYDPIVGGGCENIDECALGIDDCRRDDLCFDITPGLNEKGWECDNKNECVEDPSPCGDADQVGVICTNTSTGRTCACEPGFNSVALLGPGNVILSLDCTDRDECALGEDNCNTASRPGDCVNVPGSFTCDCPVGHGDGETCIDCISPPATPLSWWSFDDTLDDRQNRYHGSAASVTYEPEGKVGWRDGGCEAPDSCRLSALDMDDSAAVYTGLTTPALADMVLTLYPSGYIDQTRQFANISVATWVKTNPGGSGYLFRRGSQQEYWSQPDDGFSVRVEPNGNIRACRTENLRYRYWRWSCYTVCTKYFWGFCTQRTTYCYPYVSNIYQHANLCYSDTVPGVVNDGNWHHVAVTTRGTPSDHEPKIYIDGVEGSGPQTFQIVPRSSSATPTYLGESSGLMDEAMIWQGELSAAQVSAIAGAPDGFCRNQCAPGSANCTFDGDLAFCPTGFDFDGSDCIDTGASCDDGFSFLNGSCQDINECRPGGGHECGNDATCTNKVGRVEPHPRGYLCSCEDDKFSNGSDCFDCFLDESPNGLASHWPADGQANDVAGNSDGFFPAGTYADGRLGEGFAFDAGATSFVQVPDSPILQLEGGSMTISAWVQVRVQDTGDYEILDKIGDESEGDVNSGYRLTVGSGAGELTFCYAHPEIEGRRCFLSNTGIRDGQFHHVAVTKAGVGDCDDVKIYIDGQDDLAFVSGQIIPQETGSTGAMRIGARNDGTHAMVGVIDELAIFGRTLDGGEIKTLNSVVDGLCRDECTEGEVGCVCTEIECECADGYLSSGGTCVDIDECDVGNPSNNCDPDATCLNSEGGFSCACNDGFFDNSGDGTVCIDECAPGQPRCRNVDGHFRCEDGYIGNSLSCADLDECATGRDNCPDAPLAFCTNTVGSFDCTCTAGFNDAAGDGTVCEERWPVVGCGSENNVVVLDIVTASSGSVYATGYFENLGLFGTESVIGASDTQTLFVVKYDPRGTAQWARRALTAAGDTSLGVGITVDENENVYLVGEGQNIVELVPGTDMDLNSNSGFVASLNPNGDWRWSRTIKSSDINDSVFPSSIAALTTDPANGFLDDTRIYVAGWTLHSSVVAFQGSSKTASPTSFIASLDVDGNWDQVSGGEGVVQIEKIAVSVSPADPPSQPSPEPAVYGVGTNKLSRFTLTEPDLTKDWTITVPGLGHRDVEASFPNVYVGGDGFVGRFNDEGTAAGLQWETSGNASGGSIRAISLVNTDDGPELFVAGDYTSLLDVSLQDGNITFDAPFGGDSNMFLAKLEGSGGSWLWASNAISDAGLLQPRAMSNNGAAAQVAGVFTVEVEFPATEPLIATCGTDAATSPLPTEMFIAQADGSSGDWVSFGEFIVGQEVPPPVGAYTQSILPPDVYVNGSNQDTSDYFFWSPPAANVDGSGKLFITRPAGAIEIRWPVEADPSNPSRKSKVGSAIYPTTVCTENPIGPCQQVHVAGAPVETDPPDNSRKVVRVVNQGGNSSGAEVSSAVFNAPTPGWSVVEYALGGSVDSSQSPVEYEVVRTVDYRGLNDFGVDRLVQFNECEIGKPLEKTLINGGPFNEYHDQFTVADGLRTGYVINENAFYDGVGATAAYSRANRTGTIVPVNRVSSTQDRPQDDGKQMAVAWYRQNANGVYWAQTAVEYDCQWPASPERIVIASQLGNELPGQQVLDPALFPQLQLYVQDDVGLAGYNPNDEHALIRPSNRVPTSGSDAVFALRDYVTSPALPSDPYVMAKYISPESGLWAFKIYEVQAFDPIDFPKMEVTQTVGEPIRPIYPMNLLAGCGEETIVRGEVAGDLQPPVPFYRDHTGQLWARAAGQNNTDHTGGVVRFNYPLQPGFYDPVLEAPSCVGFLAELPEGRGGNAGTTPVDTGYTIGWPDTEIPLLTVGETLMKQKRGLPNIMNQAATAVAYDELQYKTFVQNQIYDPAESLVRLFRPLTTISVPLTQEQLDAAELATDFAEQGKKSVTGNSDGDLRLTPTLTRRLRFNPLARSCAIVGGVVDETNCIEGALEFRGLFDDTLAGEPLLVPNILTNGERETLKKLNGGTGTENATAAPDFEDCFPKDGTLPDTRECSWDQAIEALYHHSRNPDMLALHDPADCLVNPPPPSQEPRASCTGNRTWPGTDAAGPAIGFQDDGNGVVAPGRVLGTNAALTAGFARGSGKVTLVFNDDPSLSGLPVSLEVIDVGCLEVTPQPLLTSSYQGQIHVIDPENVFDEQVTLRHSGDFAGRADQVEFEWYIQEDLDGRAPALGVCFGDPRIKCIRDSHCPGADTCDLNGVPPWQDGPTGFGLTEITLGSPDFTLPPYRTLADNWFVVHYKLPEIDPGLGVCNDPPQWSFFAGQPSTPTNPQGQLAEGWVKRVIKALNPFDARVRAFHKAPTNTIASALTQAGERFEGPIALNNNPENLNSIGLIEAYETVRRRALTLSRGTNFSAAHNAILLISTRISDLYMLLANEAFMDAQDPTIGIRTDSEVIGTGSLAPSIFNFENQVASLLEEELILLRGRDDNQTGVVAPPVYNRFFWNFTTGQGEVAYALSYNVSDINADGFLNEFDARILYPQGHGDAWGHYLTALQTHYSLLRIPSDQDFRWVPRPEAIRVAGVPVQVDFFDERKFARAAAAKAKVGAEIVDLTYRNEYVEDVEGQWQGYKDTDEDRAWGLSGWARRAGQGAYFDWLTANAILPAEGGVCTDDASERCNTDSDCLAGTCDLPSGIQRIDRTTVDELGEIAVGFTEIQAQLDEADRGLNPLGLAKGVVPFDIDPAQVDAGKTHFEQVYDRAVGALNNAIETWNYANLLSRKLRNNQDSVADLAINTRSTERDFNGRLIEILGSPYPDDIGPGKTYPDGYNGPDLYHWQYIDLITLSGERLDEADLEAGTFDEQGNAVVGGGKIKVFSSSYSPRAGLGDNGFLTTAEPESCGEFAFDTGCALGEPPVGLVKNVNYTLFESPDFGLSPVKPPSWTGQRRVTGTVQTALQEIATSQLALKKAIRAYDDLAAELQAQFDMMNTIFALKETELAIANDARVTINGYGLGLKALKGVAAGSRAIAEAVDSTASVLAGCPPTFVIAGLAAGTDAGNAISCAVEGGGEIAAKVFTGIALGADIASEGLEFLQSDVSQQATLRAQLAAGNQELVALACAFEGEMRKEPLLRAEMLQRSQAVQQSQEKFRNELARGLRQFDALVSFRKKTAAAVQEYRYEDMGFRIFKTDALQKYRASFDLAARYAYLAATAYDYDTNLLGSDVQAGQSFLRDIVRQRNLGQVVLNKPVAGSRGLTDPLGRMEQNFAVLKGQMGFNNPQLETNRFSLREENFEPRLSDGAEDDLAWKDRLEAFVVEDIWDDPEFRSFARPFAPEPPPDCQDGGPIPCTEPAIVIPFDTTVTFALNFFGLPLEGGDSAYDPSNFSTRIRAAGVWFKGYPDQQLSQTPRVYLMPVGEDVLRAAEADNFETRQWAVFDQVLPVPFSIGESDLSDENWLPNDSLSGSFGEIRRFASMRAYPLDAVDDTIDPSEFVTDSRLIGRSVWNTRWVLIIPAGTLLNDREQGLQLFLDNVKDIQFFFQTYAYQGD